jgi:glutathione peroxidase
MKTWMFGLALAGAVAAVLAVSSVRADVKAEGNAPSAAASGEALGFTVKDIDGKDVDLSSYKGKVVMIINVASKCGNTKQYTGLEAMYQKYKDQGFVILAFPANNFGGQEPGSEAQIKEFCTGADSKYKVSFPLFSKISVKGADMAPLYKHLTALETKPKGKGDVKWNFEKFLIAKDGTVAGRFDPGMKPEDPKLVAAVEEQLKK